jgi:chromosomal replication initiator protein
MEGWVGQGWIALLIGALEQLTHGGCSLAILPASAQTLDDFAESPVNRSALTRAEEIATSPGQAPGISVFHGPAGCGKTHLLRAIRRRLAVGQPAPPIAARDTHALSLELISSLQGDRPVPFRSELRDARVLILDSGEALRSRILIQDELLAALEQLEGRACPIVLGARDQVFDDDCLQPRLRDRLRESRLFCLHPGGRSTHANIVARRLSAWGLDDPEQTTARFLTSLGPGLADLDRLITSTFARCRSIADLHHCELPARPGQPASQRHAPVDPRSVLKVVCQHFNLRPAELRTSSRSPRVTLPRQISMYLMRRHSDLSYPEIGQRFHRHHTTGIHAYRRISSGREKNSDLRATLDLLEKELIRLLDDGDRG